MRWFFGLLVLLLAALFLESGALAYSAYALMGMFLLSRFLGKRWTAALTATRVCRLLVAQKRPGLVEEPNVLAAEVGDRLHVSLTIKNNGWLPVPWFLIEDLLPRFALDARYPRLKVKGKRLHVGMIWGGGELEINYAVECLGRGYFQIGPAIVENGDLFGLYRRFRVETEPRYLLVYPKVVPLTGYDLTSQRPIGDIVLTHRLFEDPTRIAGVRPYEPGDPMNRVHWKVTARTGTLHCKLNEPTVLAGATILLDLHREAYHERGEPYRSELAVTTAAALAGALCEIGQQVGLITNGGNCADRVRAQRERLDPRTRREARQAQGEVDEVTRMAPLIVPTKRGSDQLQRIREILALVELGDGLDLARLVLETQSRMPRDATVLAILARVPEATAIALGNLRRQGYAVTVVLVILEGEALDDAYKRLMAQNIRDIRHLAQEEMLPDLCRAHVDRNAPYQMV
jgi:uncharacterized protein (DUF58 family)